MKPALTLLSTTNGMRREVPYFSQYDERIPPEWQRRSCGIVSLRMALGAVVPHVELPSSSELITLGVSNGAYVAGVGWRHDGLARLATLCGAQAYRAEFRIRNRLTPRLLTVWLDKAFVLYGIATLRQSVNKGVVPIISVTVDGKSDTHLVPIVSWGRQEGELGFFYHEPASDPEDTDALYRFLSINELKRRWRRLAIFVCPNEQEVSASQEHPQLRTKDTMPPNPFRVRWSKLYEQFTRQKVCAVRG